MTGQPSGWGADFIQGKGQLPLPPPALAPALLLCLPCALLPSIGPCSCTAYRTFTRTPTSSILNLGLLLTSQLLLLQYKMLSYCRDRAAGCISFGHKWKTGTGRQYFTDIIGLSSTKCDIIGLQSNRIR